MLKMCMFPADRFTTRSTSLPGANLAVLGIALNDTRTTAGPQYELRPCFRPTSRAIHFRLVDGARQAWHVSFAKKTGNNHEAQLTHLGTRLKTEEPAELDRLLGHDKR